MNFNFKLLRQLILITLFDSRRRGVRVTPQRFVILTVFLLVMVPVFLISAKFSWWLDDVLFPGYRRRKVEQPVFIIGNPRSGTTFLHRLMVRDERNFIHFRTWELGFAPTITQRRLYQIIGRVDRLVGGPLTRIVQKLNKRILQSIEQHPTGLWQAEEDDLILLYVWSSTFILGVFPYPDEVLARILPFDQLPEERQRVMPFYEGAVKRHLHVRQTGRRKLLSKNPVFSSRVDALYESFPDARFVYLIRSPLNVLPSLGSYARTVWRDFQGETAKFPYDEHIWDTVWWWYRYTLHRLEQAPPESYIIVNYDDLTANPRETVRRIYEHFGFELDPEFDRILVEANEKSRRYKSSHDYTLEDTGFTREQIVEEYADLFERFGFDMEG